MIEILRVPTLHFEFYSDSFLRMYILTTHRIPRSAQFETLNQLQRLQQMTARKRHNTLASVELP